MKAGVVESPSFPRTRESRDAVDGQAHKDWIPVFTGMTICNPAGNMMSVCPVTAVGGKVHE